MTVQDLYLAGSETTGGLMSYFFLYVTLYPEIQRKIQLEIDDVIHRGSSPSLDHVEQYKTEFFHILCTLTSI